VLESDPEGVLVLSDTGKQRVPKDVAQLMWVYRPAATRTSSVP
jgi:hypothetical protein